MGPAITSTMGDGSVESEQDLPNENQSVDQKEKITHLYTKRLPSISC